MVVMEEDEEAAGPSAEPSLTPSEPHRESADKATQYSCRKPQHRSFGMFSFALQLSALQPLLSSGSQTFSCQRT